VLSAGLNGLTDDPLSVPLEAVAALVSPFLLFRQVELLVEGKQ